MNTQLSPDDPTYLYHWIVHDLMNAIVGVMNNIKARVHADADFIIDLATTQVSIAWYLACRSCDIAEASRLSATLDEMHNLERVLDNTIWNLQNSWFGLCVNYPGTTFPPPTGKDSPPCTPPNPPSAPSTEASSV